MDPPLISEASRITIPEKAFEAVVVEAPAGDRQVDVIDWLVCGTTIALVLVVFRAAFVNNLFHPLLFTLLHSGTWSAIIQPSLLWGLMGTLFLGFRTVLWFCYRPFPSATHRNAPTLT